MRVPAFSVILSLVLGCGVYGAGVPALTPPPAPFAKAASSQVKEERFKAERLGNRIVCGNKELVFGADGVVKYYADDRLLADINLPFTLVDNSTRNKQWLAPDVNWPEKYFDLKASGKTTRDGREVYRKVIQNDGKRAECLTSFELREDGKVALRYTWTELGSPTVRLRPSTLMIASPKAMSQGAGFEVDGVTGVVPDHDAGVVCRRAPFKEAVILSDIATRLVVTATPSCAEFQVDVRSGGTLFRVTPKSGNTVEVLLDISRGVARRNGGRTFGGIDFKAIDDLELPDFAASRNLIQNPSFERGLDCLWTQWHMAKYEGAGTWTTDVFSVDASVSFHGTQSLKLSAPAITTGDCRFIGRQVRTLPVPVEPGPYTFSFYAKGQSGHTQRVAVWFPCGAWFGPRNIFLPIPGASKVFELTSEWKRYSLTFEVPQSTPVFASLGADTKNGNANVWMDALQLEKGAAVTDFTPPLAEGQLITSRNDNFLSPDDRIDAGLRISSKPGCAGKARVTVRDFFGVQCFGGEYPFTCDPAGRAQIRLPLDGVLPRGVFVVRSEYDLGNGRSTHDFHRLAIMNFLENKHRLKNIFAENYASPEGRADFLKLLERYRKTGIGAKDHIYNWDKTVWDSYQAYGIEPVNSFMATDIRPYVNGKRKLLGFAIRDGSGSSDDLDSKGPKTLIRDYRSEGARAPSEEYLGRFRAAVAEVARSHPWIPLWAFHGEVLANYEPSWWSGEGSVETGYANLARILVAFQEGVKQGNPKALVFQDAPSNMSPDRGIADTDRLLAEVGKQNKARFDTIGIHTYRNSPESPDLDADAQTLFAMLAKHGYDKTPVFWPEGMHYGPYNIPQWEIVSASWLAPHCWYYGALSYDMGWTEKISAAWRARSWLVALKYQDRIQSFMSSAFVNNFEMDLNLTPFASQKISNTLGRLLGDARFRKDSRFAPYVRCYVFEDAAKRPVAAVWCHHPKVDAGTMEAPMASAEFGGSLDQVFDLMECEHGFKVDEKGMVAFPVSSFPLFFRGRTGTIEAFLRAFENATIISSEGVAPLMLSGKPVAADTVQISARNYMSKPYTGTVSCADQRLPLEVPGSGVASVSAKLPEPLRADRIVTEYLPLTVQAGQSSFRGDVSFDGFLCRRAPREIRIDGELDDWKDIPTVVLTNRQIMAGTTGPVRDADFSGWFKVAWSEGGLSLCVSIRDDLFVHDTLKNAGERWCNDSLQIYFDSCCDARAKQQLGYDENDYDYAVLPNPDGKSATVYRQRTPDPQLGLAVQAPHDRTVADDIPVAFKRTAEGYSCEIFFPAKYLLPIRLEQGYALGLGLFINDCDDAVRPYPNRVKSALTVTPNGTGCFNSPHLWPAMLLER